MNKPSIQQRLSDEARALPQRSHGWFRTWFKKVWDVRGGGLYAVGFAVTFLWLEVTSIFDDIAGIGMVFDGQAVEFVIGFIVDSFKNTLAAFMWPVDIVTWKSPWGAIILGLAFWLFPIFVKPHIEKWMFDEDAAVDEETSDS
ncbi:MAG: hypothetical protein AAFN50_11635 [Pseudomonadota bacterium]